MTTFPIERQILYMAAEMSNSTEEECDTIPAVTSVVFILTGLLVQSFIVAVNVFDWRKGRAMTATDMIITSIGISRMFSLISCLLNLFSVLYPTELNTIFGELFLFLWQSSDFSSLCLSSLLSVFFCFKISTFHNVFFLRVKVIVSRCVVSLIVASMLLGIGLSSMFYLVVYIGLCRNVSGNCRSVFEKYNVITTFLYALCNIVPILLYLASSVLLVISLSFHMRRMKSSGTVLSSTDTFQRVIMYTVVSCVTCAFCVIVNASEDYGIRAFGVLWMYSIWNMFPFLYSVCLIYITNKLRSRFCVVVRWGTYCLFRRKASILEPGDEVEVKHL